jgi:hypothetical protein
VKEKVSRKYSLRIVLICPTFSYENTSVSNVPFLDIAEGAFHRKEINQFTVLSTLPRKADDAWNWSPHNWPELPVR